MRVALIDTTKKPRAYSIALLKIGEMLRKQGHKCKLFVNKLPARNQFDEIWLSTVFTYDIPHAIGIALEARKRAPRVKIGGISATLMPEMFEKHGFEVHRGLIPEAEGLQPDYRLLHDKEDYSIAYTSRGCVRKCGFCMVKTLEPKFEERSGWENTLKPGAQKILFYDNNWLAKGKASVRKDVKKIKTLMERGRIKTVDFNQGLDARLVDEEMADILAEITIYPFRVAFDGMQEDGHVQRAFELMFQRGYKSFSSYVLYNYHDTPEDFYYRLREISEFGAKTKKEVAAIPMRYQPITEITRDYVGKHWTPEMKKAFMVLLGAHSAESACVSVKRIEEFEMWFGKNAQEFVRLLKYPKIRELTKRKQGALRYLRAQGETYPTFEELSAGKPRRR